MDVMAGTRPDGPVPVRHGRPRAKANGWAVGEGLPRLAIFSAALS